MRYEGESFVAISGRHQARVPVEAVRALYEAFVKTDFFWTLDEYRAAISDLPTHTISISFDGRTKKVVDYGGQAIGMPKEIGELENAIDATAETTKWVKGDENTFASLEAEDWDFRSQRDNNLSLIESSATSGNLDLLSRLLEAGVRADTTFGCFGLQSAAYAGNTDVVLALTNAKAPVHWEPPKDREDEPCDALSMAAMSGVTAIVHAILEQRPDVDWRNFFGRTPLMLAAEAYSDKKRPERDFAATARMLIAAGADVNLRDEDGESAIMKVRNDADVVRVLLAAGAKDINKPLRGGNTVIMHAYDPEVTRALLEGGADAWFVNRGENAFEYVSRTYGRDNASAAVLSQWMSAHPKPN